MLPLPQVTELDELPPEFTVDTLWPGLAQRRSLAGHGADGHLDVALLQEFKLLMGLEGWPVQIARMCYDRLYAYERIAQAHASANSALRQVALQLFHAYHRLDEIEAAGGPLHS
jgi:hypothetical protein